MAAEAGSEVDYFVASDPPLIIEACIWIQGWYKDTSDPPPRQSDHRAHDGRYGGTI